MRKPADGRAARGAGGGCGALRVKWNGCPSPTPAGGQERRRRRVRPRLRRAGQEGGRARGGWGRRPAARERGARGGTPPPRGGRAGDVSPAGRKGRARGSLSILFSHDLREPRVARTDGPGRPQESKASTGKGGHECLQYLPDRHVQEQPPPQAGPSPTSPPPAASTLGHRPCPLARRGRGHWAREAGAGLLLGAEGHGEVARFATFPRGGKSPPARAPRALSSSFRGNLCWEALRAALAGRPAGKGGKGRAPRPPRWGCRGSGPLPGPHAPRARSSTAAPLSHPAARAGRARARGGAPRPLAADLCPPHPRPRGGKVREGAAGAGGRGGSGPEPRGAHAPRAGAHPAPPPDPTLRPQGPPPPVRSRPAPPFILSPGLGAPSTGRAGVAKSPARLGEGLPTAAP